MSTEILGIPTPAGGVIHAGVYSDPALFEREQALLFRRTWLYVGHDSQAPKAGDFYTTTLAGEPVIAIRGEDGRMRVFFNRCPHRGAILSRHACGHAQRVVCGYHGWTFLPSGALDSIPWQEGYDGTPVVNDPAAFGLPPVPRCDSYRGFLFASLAESGQGLVDYLGPGAINLDNLVERSPIGEIEVAFGVFRMVQRNNWKVYLENLHDGVHAVPTHQSSIEPAKHAMEQARSEWTAMRAEIVAANSQPPRAMANVAVNCYANGHSDMSAFRKTRPQTPGQIEYEALLAERVGRDGVERILGIDRNNAVFYPGLTVQPNYMQLRIIVPLSVDRTRVDIYSFRLKGAPDWINNRILAFANTIHSPASLVRADDLENFERIQDGYAARTAPWVSAHRDLAREGDEPVGPSNAMSERYVRNQFAAWTQYMSAP